MLECISSHCYALDAHESSSHAGNLSALHRKSKCTTLTNSISCCGSTFGSKQMLKGIWHLYVYYFLLLLNPIWLYPLQNRQNPPQTSPKIHRGLHSMPSQKSPTSLLSVLSCTLVFKPHKSGRIRCSKALQYIVQRCYVNSSIHVTSLNRGLVFVAAISCIKWLANVQFQLQKLEMNIVMASCLHKHLLDHSALHLGIRWGSKQ